MNRGGRREACRHARGMQARERHAGTRGRPPWLGLSPSSASKCAASQPPRPQQGEAEDGRDAVSKTLFSICFLWLVHKINESMKDAK